MEQDQIRLPCNIQAEAALLGALLIENNLIDHARDLQPQHFFEQLHGRIFERIVSLINEGKTASQISVWPWINSRHSALS
jgi:replicative DNA helicase